VRITRAFEAFGHVCAVNKECLKKVGDRPPDHDYGADIANYSAVRVLVLLDNTRVVKPLLVLRNLGGGLGAIAKVRVAKFWDHPDGAPLPTDRDFSDWGDDDAAGNTSPPPRERFDSLGRVASTSRGRSGLRHAGNAGGPTQRLGSCRALGALLYPSVPLWSFAAGAMSALGRALSLADVPQVVVRDLPTPVRPVTPPTVSPDVVELHRSPSALPFYVAAASGSPPRRIPSTSTPPPRPRGSRLLSSTLHVPLLA